mgnify:CR=1 FL=1
MDVRAYLDRIGYHGDTTPTLPTLNAIHQAHLMAIPYENLNIHLGRYLPVEPSAALEKIVTQRRGGWCYEMNGVMAWALCELGYPVTLLASCVGGEGNERNHLILRVDLDRPYLVDVGFGNGLLRPIPLEPGQYQQHGFEYALENVGDRWIFTNQPYGASSFEFSLEPHQIHDFVDRCHWLQTSPESRFVQIVVSYRFNQAGYVGLHGAVLKHVTAEGKHEAIIEDETAYRRVLEEQFDLHLTEGEITALWQIVWQKHQHFLEQQRQQKTSG